MIETRSRPLVFVLLAVALVLGVAGAVLAGMAGETSADIGAAAAGTCTSPTLPAWVYLASWAGTVVAAYAIVVALAARAMVPRRSGILRGILPALVAAPAVVYGTGFIGDDGRTQTAGVIVAVFIVAVTIGLYLLTRKAVPTVPSRFRWLAAAVLTVTVLAFLLALVGLDSVFMATPNGLPVCGG